MHAILKRGGNLYNCTTNGCVNFTFILFIFTLSKPPLKSVEGAYVKPKCYLIKKKFTQPLVVQLYMFLPLFKIACIYVRVYFCERIYLREYICKNVYMRECIFERVYIHENEYPLLV